MPSFLQRSLYESCHIAVEWRCFCYRFCFAYRLFLWEWLSYRYRFIIFSWSFEFNFAFKLLHNLLKRKNFKILNVYGIFSIRRHFWLEETGDVFNCLVLFVFRTFFWHFHEVVTENPGLFGKIAMFDLCHLYFVVVKNFYSRYFLQKNDL